MIAMHNHLDLEIVYVYNGELDNALIVSCTLKSNEEFKNISRHN